MSDVVAVSLTRRGISMADLVELRIRVELALVDSPSTGPTPTARPNLRSALEHEATMSMAEFADGGHDLHAVIAGLAGNRALELVALVLVRLMRLHQVEEVTEEDRAARRRRGVAGPRRHRRRHLDGDGDAAAAACGATSRRSAAYLR